jgi:hypothetical protein
MIACGNRVRRHLIFGARHGTACYTDRVRGAGAQAPELPSGPCSAGRTNNGRAEPATSSLTLSKPAPVVISTSTFAASAMVDDVRRMLKEARFERRRVIYEKYD